MKQIFKKSLSYLLVCVLFAAMTLTTGCGDKVKAVNENVYETIEGCTLGEGNTEFAFSVVDESGNQTDFTIRTDETSVGNALQKVNLIYGEEGPYGLYVKTVNGITADYETSGTYWAFYINGEYAMTGVDTTTVETGSQYTLKVEK